ncbi:hypothetical protein NC652_011373 [Populus alba x Populus x berolinensis]|uniref:Uncharacterized protein n=1 Tax=Populus alba x Populus x berolinensis TaxID=444605 RepID=A0AAD6R3K9_9ROSI|nr:hypothetical protein NC652_011369 [Populus alba x Populus x berolinensis]KAJ6936635.1 hypothetical protein NC652_011373 [Populus alba x Populus x berolinensis]KAJ7000972.1 hypothetical protein NC653_011432 [Populus alba x Populus x berolinensis]
MTLHCPRRSRSPRVEDCLTGLTTGALPNQTHD